MQCLDVHSAAGEVEKHPCDGKFLAILWGARERLCGVGCVILNNILEADSLERLECDPAKVIKAAQQEGFKFPVLIDLEERNWKAWGNTMWPTVYVVDKKGYIRFWWQGELNWLGTTTDKKIESVVDQLLKEE